ncbi:multiple sugar transport system substrate-binding protein [Cohnella sp. SGD-V74]|uniref:ABC transporter substrate-binding protein n=1 Tax=unclassified Cohnella TaxID=2636738 RepID=UPI000D4496BD|nr:MULTISPECIES: extracellular solute-binding protein [unclassified Cohnella]PRX72997.1 multiple sugar transport system substrate-binding protein [Cohnella sp. SGD-V74]
MKKRLGLVLLSVLVMAMLTTACSGSNGNDSGNATTNKNNNGEVVRLKIWGGTPEENGPKQVVENWNAQNPNIQVEYVRFVNDDAGNTKLDTALYSGKDVDIFIGYTPTLRNKRIDAGVVEPLDAYINGDSFDLDKNFGSDNIEVIDDHIYYIPAQKAIDGILINKTMLDEIGEPLPSADWTWGDLADLSKKLTTGEGANKRYGFMFDYATTTISFEQYMAMSEVGADYYYNADGSSSFDQSYWKEIYALHQRMQNVDGSVYPYGDVVTAKPSLAQEFVNEKAAMIFGSFHIRSVKDLENYPHDFVTAVLPIPTLNKDTKSYNGFGMQDFLSISKNSQNKDAAWEFIKWYSTEGYSPMVDFGRVPSWKDYDVTKIVEQTVGENAHLFDIDSMKAFYSGNYNFSFPKNNTARSELDKLIKEETEQLILNDKSIDDTLASLKERADKLIGERK